MIKKIFFIAIVCLVSLTSCDKLASKIVSKTGKEVAEEATERSAKEVTKRAMKAGAKELAEEGAETALAKSLKELATSNKTCKFFYENINKEFTDGVVVKTTKNSMEIFSKEYPASAIKIQGNTIIGKAGSLIEDGHMNEFFNYILPNKTYIVDDVFSYKTDELGRVVTCSSDRTKAFNKLAGKRNDRNTDIQGKVIEKLGGIKGLDDSGHLFDKATGGPNELINQVPMLNTVNRGEVKTLEKIEGDALKAGKQVTSQRNLLYRGDEMRPYAIEFVTKIDGVETKTIVQNID